jgi:MFS transporter, ACS family, tartrate transporter
VTPVDPTGQRALSKASWRILPLLFLGYGIAYIDRLNISFAALQMNQELHFTAVVYGLGGGLFFLSYALFEVPSNLLLIRLGARRWIARIMLTWGVIAVAMMFVRTPLQFYIARFLLGAAEAGFFPGVLYYLTQWFPAAYRGRAISRFYFAFPISAAVMGALAGPLLALNGRLGLAGWQWLFLVEGLPAILLGVVILFALPEIPSRAGWLSQQERQWLEDQLSLQAAVGAPEPRQRDGILQMLMDPKVLMIGLCNVFVLGSSYAFGLSAPAVLKTATQWTTAQVGLFMSATAIVGAFTMVFNGSHSDRYRERYLHTIIPLAVVACALLSMGISTAAWTIPPAYFVYYTAYTALQATFWLIPADSLRGRSAAVGLAGVGSIGMLGSFAGPIIWGVMKDRTGTFAAGLLTLAIANLIAATLLSIARYRTRTNVAASVATS